ncbi:hypothetical protein AAFF_G00126570 [Aldrovandia affinis]|uniref:Integrase core domain-containing protein n=1 Tax=Aldrovandia affinis TaxID=143900 RepID=A0AAD7W9H6_9TELE|nr:hypothetical protein AAFF_G00126570 [Aldrovandia affinis]
MNEMALLNSLADHMTFPQEVLEGLSYLISLTWEEMDRRRTTVVVEEVVGGMGRPKLSVSKDHLQELIEMDLSVPCISKMLGVSVHTINRRIQVWGFNVRNTYSQLNDDELDNLVCTIKATSPNLGYRMVRGHLRALGHRVQWARVWESMHRVDAKGIHERLANLGCVVRRVYSVPHPFSLVHVDTNHKLIRYGIVIFGGIDGFSRKIMYLHASNNNKAATALEYFLESTRKHGFPSRVRGDQGVENVDIARCMFQVRGCGTGSFISGKSVHNQRIERLWRDVWNVVSNIYYDVLQSRGECSTRPIKLHPPILCPICVPAPHPG